jgi:ferredoxin-nitrite reductase
MSGDFNPEQKRYLEGFVAGLQIAKAARGNGGAPSAQGTAAFEPTGPDAPHLRAQDRVLLAGGKLSEQEKFKRELHPFDGYDRLKAQAENNEYPKPPDNFRWRYFGLFYVAPNQNSYMCRLRMPNGILSHGQFAGIADLAERYGGGYAHVTTRANLQVREIEAHNAVAMIEAIQDLGLCSRGSGADNIRNVTGSPTAGIDRQELIDTRPFAREWHFHILNERALYGLPRKFNVGFDGAGLIPVLEDTNDIGFQAVEVKDGFDIAPGVWFRLMIGGITGHKDFARETGVVVRPADATKVADAIVRVFIDHGDRTDRNKARLKYGLDRLGLEKVLALTEEKLGRSSTASPAMRSSARPPFDRSAHIGVHPRSSPTAVDRRRASGQQNDRRSDARARRSGQGSRRRRHPAHRLAEPDHLGRAVGAGRGSAEAKIREQLGFSISANSIRAGLVACTGNAGCKFAPPIPSGMPEIARWCEERVALDGPVNIHLTRLSSSCAQHYIGDVFGTCSPARGANVEEGDTVGLPHSRRRRLRSGRGDRAGDLPRRQSRRTAPGLIRRMLKAYLARARLAAGSFLGFSRRHDLDSLRSLIEREAVE